MAQENNDNELTFGDGKYTITGIETGNLQALRHGESWRSLVGDKMVLSLVQEIQHLRSREETTKSE